MTKSSYCIILYCQNLEIAENKKQKTKTETRKKGQITPQNTGTSIYS